MYISSERIHLCFVAFHAGIKVSILFEELGLDYDAHGNNLVTPDIIFMLIKNILFFLYLVINIGKGDQFTSGFVKVNPNSKIPACVDRDGPNGS